MAFLESKQLQQKICDEVGIPFNSDAPQPGYFNRDMMSRLLIFIQNAKEQIKNLKEMGNKNDSIK